MNAQLRNRISSLILIVLTAVVISGCSDDDTIQSSQPRIVGDPSQPATLYDVVQAEDCEDIPDSVSTLTGHLNNVDLNEVKVVMYSSAGSYYGTIRVFENDGSFSMELPCDRRVRLLLAKSDWTAVTSYSSGPPTASDTILAIFWDIERVVGSVTGDVSDARDKSYLDGVIVSWLVDGTTEKDTTNDVGFFSVESTLDPGTYTFTFSKTGYAVLTADGVIPSLEELRGDLDTYPGDILYPLNLKILLPPMTASLSGTVTRFDPISTDTVVADNVEVQLLLNDNITPNVLKDTTDANGQYSFDAVPAGDSLSLVIPSFVVSSFTYGPVDTTLTLYPGPTVIDALISASGGGSSFRLISLPNSR